MDDAFTGKAIAFVIAIVGPLVVVGGVLAAVGRWTQRLLALEDHRKDHENRLRSVERWRSREEGRQSAASKKWNPTETRDDITIQRSHENT